MEKWIFDEFDKIFKTESITKVISTYDREASTTFKNKKVQALLEKINLKQAVNGIEIEVMDVIPTHNYLCIKSSLGTFYTTKNMFKNDGFKIGKMQLIDFYHGILDFDYRITKVYSEKVYIDELYKSYMWYKAITELDKNLLFKITSSRINPKLIPWEILNSKEFNSFAVSNVSNFYNHLQDVYMIRPFNDNKKLIFDMFISSNNELYLNFILENFKEFVDFIKKEGHVRTAQINKCLLENNLYDKISEENLIEIYKHHPQWVITNPEIFKNISHKVKNKSKIVNLDGTRNAHLQYRKYDLYNEVPIDIINKDDDKYDKYRKGLTEFELTFLQNNAIIVKLYKFFYKNYKNSISSDEEDNIQSFINAILTQKNLIMMYKSAKFTAHEISRIENIAIFLNKENKSLIENIKINLRKQYVAFYNKIVNAKNSKEKFNEILNIYNLSLDKFIDFVFNNKFYYSIEKEVLIKIYENLFGNPLRISDILMLIDEMLDRDLSLNEILKEKGIPFKIFKKIYDSLKENNPMIYTYIKECLNENRRKGFIKIIKLGYMVLNSNITSLSEYNERFSNVPINDLLSSLEKTELYDKLIEKISNFSDMDEKSILKLKKEN